MKNINNCNHCKTCHAQGCRDTGFLSCEIKGPVAPRGPQGPHGPTGPEAVLAYGGLYNDNTQIITIPPEGTVGVDLPENIESKNVTLVTNIITIDIDGDYRVEYFIQLQYTSDAFGLLSGVKINGLFSEPSLINNSVLTSDFMTITLSSIVALNAGDELTLALSSLTGGSILFGPGTSAKLSVMRLGS